MQNFYLLYDSMYLRNPKRSLVLYYTRSEEEARKKKEEFHPNSIIVKYKDRKGKIVSPVIIG